MNIREMSIPHERLRGGTQKDGDKVQKSSVNDVVNPWHGRR